MFDISLFWIGCVSNLFHLPNLKKRIRLNSCMMIYLARIKIISQKYNYRCNMPGSSVVLVILWSGCNIVKHVRNIPHLSDFTDEVQDITSEQCICILVQERKRSREKNRNGVFCNICGIQLVSINASQDGNPFFSIFWLIRSNLSFNLLYSPVQE